LFQFLPLSHAAALNGKSTRSSRIRLSQEKNNATSLTDSINDAVVKNSLSFLMNNEKNIDEVMERLSPVLSTIAAARDESFLSACLTSQVSEKSFFQLSQGGQKGIKSPSLLNNALEQIANHCLSTGVSVRHFKTLRTIEAENDKTSRFFSRFRRSSQERKSLTGIDAVNAKSQEGLSKLITNSLSPEEQAKLKSAFGEGYMVGTKGLTGSKSREKTIFYLQVVYYAMSIVLLFYVLRVLGSMFTKPSRSSSEVYPEDRNVTFDDVKGADEAKAELKEIVEFLRNPEKFSSLGGKIPRGVLLVGPPGTGKTLLARAVAGEAGVPYFHAAGPEFEEMLVGVGAKRVRELFSAAKDRAPCVIFIDEIDSVGGKRTNSALHPYANQTINQLLSAMDGFHPNEGVIVLGATNRRDDLDKALLRPGRFDMEVQVPPPDFSGRVDILKLYLGKVKTGTDVVIEKLARGTTGFTGADLENLVNQAAVRAAMDGAIAVTMKHLEHSRDKILMGPERKSRIPDQEGNRITAFHEAGHALVAHYTKGCDPLHKVTIIPRGVSLGHTSYMPEKEKFHVTKLELLAQMDSMMGGRAAEELTFGTEKITSGASSDLKSATAIAKHMVKDLGMSEKVGLRTFDDNGNNIVAVSDLSPQTSEMIDSEIHKILQDSYDRAKTILKNHKEELKLLADALLKYETLDFDDVKVILDKKNPNVK
ncbi:hypothetical protein QYM36_005789, partial [Artemia franciscana]